MVVHNHSSEAGEAIEAEHMTVARKARVFQQEGAVGSGLGAESDTAIGEEVVLVEASGSSEDGLDS